MGAVTRGEEVIIPVGDTRIQPGDHVIAFSVPKALPNVDKLF